MSSNLFQPSTILTFNCEEEAEVIVAEIMNELNLEEEANNMSDLCLIQVRSPLHDTAPAMRDKERINRFRRLIANGEYQVNPTAIARAVLESGDI